jgi:hypothetical protein
MKVVEVEDVQEDSDPVMNLTRIRMVLSTEEVQEIFQGMKGTKKVMTKTMTLNRDHQILI